VGELLSIKGLAKAYGGAVALRDASLSLNVGEMLALMGENGAGKSTLIKILAGAVAADGGEIRIGDRTVSPRSPAEAHRLGLRFIHQELVVVPGLSVAENILLGRPYPSRFGLVDWRALNARAGAALAMLGVTHISPQAIMSRLPVGDRMLVKIASALLESAGDPARLFVMDEPTAALNGEESERLFQVVTALRGRGCGVLYVSHRLDEVLALADRIVVLRDGETAATLDAKRATKAQLIAAMTGGREIENARGASGALDASVALSVEGLSGQGLHDVAFDIRRGEILGVAGLAGARADRLTRALIDGAGRVRLEGAPITLRGPADAWAKGIALVPRERRAEGLLLMQDVARNVALPHHSWLNRWGWFLSRTRERATVLETGKRVRLKARGPEQKLRTLSGGNQQKVMFARAVAGPLRALLLDEPTRGVDVGAKFDIYALLRELAAAGAAVLIVLSDQEELLHICSRIAVMREGRVALIASAATLTPQKLLALCYGES
jgi:ABC-type sugar transport system ATPase subunit